MVKILVVEDNDLEFNFISRALLGASVTRAVNIYQAKGCLTKETFSAAFVDYELPDGTGNDLIQWAAQAGVVSNYYLMSAFGTIPRAIEALKLGAQDFLEKPIDPHLIHNIVKALSTKAGCSQTEFDYTKHIVRAPSSPLNDTLKLALAVGPKNCPVHIHGESGTGKELIADIIHKLSPRSQGPRISINCAAIPDNLIESELFGFKKGAFTGAVSNYKGKFEQAHHGTLFMDEIGEMPLHIQSKILRVIQEKQITPIGGTEEVKLDFRIVSASHRSLINEVNEGHFREDLFFRLNVFQINIPPLRERTCDIPLLIHHFLQKHLSFEEARAESLILPNQLLNNHWPGNIRELLNVAERYLIIRELGKSWIDALQPPEGRIKGFSLPKPNDPYQQADLSGKISDQEILNALEQCNYNRARTAAHLGVSRRNLQYRLAKIKKEKSLNF